MLPVALVHSLAAKVPDYQLTAAILLAAALVTLMVGAWRAGHGFARHIPAVLYLAIGAAAIWPLSLTARPWLHWLAVLLAAAAFIIHLRLDRHETAEPWDDAVDAQRSARLYAAATLIAAGMILFNELGTYTGYLLNWESPVMTEGFGPAFTAGKSVLEYTARRFLWDDGILSAGQTSLFYGAPTYALFTAVGFSPWTLRVAAVIATLLSIATIYAFARRFFGGTVAGAVAVLLGLNTCVLFYGRYGSSPAGTVLATLLALWSAWAFLDRDRSAWWMGAVCAITFFAATLQYSPARLVLVILIGFMVLMLVYQWRRLWWRRAAGFALIVAAAAGVWQLERHYHVEHLFLHARGEQFFQFLQEPDQIKSLFGKEMLSHHVRPEELTLSDKLELLYRVLETTVPQYLSIMGPVVSPPAQGAVMEYDPPALQLYYAPLVLFIIWGLAHSLSRRRSWRHLCLLAWVAGTTVPLLLTNRVDSHRSMLMTIPLSIWAALGVWEAARVLHAARVPRVVQHACAALLALTMIYSDVNILYYAQVPKPMVAETLVAEVQSVPGPVAVGALWNHREIALADLTLLERARLDPRRSSTLLSEGLVHNISDEHATPVEMNVRQVESIAKQSTVLLAPASRFRGAAAALQRRGVRVAERGTQQCQIMRLDGGAAISGVPDDQMQPLPTIFIPPTPTPIALRGGPQMSLSQLTPHDITWGFEPPKIDRAFDDAPILMGDVRYDRGIGTHAWTRMTYDVPEGATAFQAIIGLSDSVLNCAAAAVTFEVRDETDHLLYDSGLVDVTNPLKAMLVELHGAKAITLVVTEGGNGRDCDHANWAQPAFLMGPAPTPTRRPPH
jgi:hypothetical protein